MEAHDPHQSFIKTPKQLIVVILLAFLVPIIGQKPAASPKLGDKAAWAPRIKAGTGAMVQSVIKGKGAMPPKAGNPSLSDAEVRAAVEFMVLQSK